MQEHNNSNNIVQEAMEETKQLLSQITCYEVFLSISYVQYYSENGVMMEDAQGDRGEHYIRAVAKSKEEFIAFLLHKSIYDFAFEYEFRHRRPFEDNRRQVNEIMERCYSYFDGRFSFQPLSNLKDNIHIYFDLLDYYQQISKKLQEDQSLIEEVKERIRFIVNYEYANKNHGMWNVPFTMSLVRYQIHCIVSFIPDYCDLYYLYENEYERLLELEKVNPVDNKKYQLGSWDYDIFEHAEQCIRQMDQNRETSMINNKSQEVKECIYLWLLTRVHTGRNLAQDTHMLLLLINVIGFLTFEDELRELYVTDEYGVYRCSHPEHLDIWKEVRELLNFR